LIGVASTAAQADELPQPAQLETPSSPSFVLSPSQSGNVTGATINTTQTLSNVVNQDGLVNVNVSPNILIGETSASTSGHRQEFNFQDRLPGLGSALAGTEQ